MSKTFPGFSPKALSFFRKLEKNNTREWFQPRKPEFEEVVRGPMLELVGCVCDELRKFAVDHVVPAEKAIFRIYRDTRFSKDKTPYKTHIAAAFPRAGVPKHSGAEYYFAVSHTGLDIAGGMYMPGPDELLAVRTAIAQKEKAFRSMISEKSVRKLLGEIRGEQMARVPKAFAPDHPAADLLRWKQFYFLTTLKPTVAQGKTATREILTRFKAMRPVVEFINNAILSAMREKEPAEDRPKRPEPMF